MHPAFSVLFFTTLSGLGYGLLFWLGLQAALWPSSLHDDLGLLQLLLGLLLSTVGLLSSLAHLGHPERAWRAFSQWRSSWLSREGVLALATLLPALWLGALLLGERGEPALRACGAVLAFLAAGTVLCTAMIYASLKPIPAWRDRWVLPVYLGFMLAHGGLGAVAVQLDAPGWPLAAALGSGLLVLAAMKWCYWRRIDAQRLPSAAAALGLPAGTRVGRFEAPHSEASYLTREMGFALARRHRRRLRRLALALLLPLPIAFVAVFSLAGIPAAGYALATVLVWLGALVERWLFFAEARHVVSVYYPGSATAAADPA
jgi:sulfite dehydrogenase (quinone) subunit SoeC